MNSTRTLIIGMIASVLVSGIVSFAIANVTARREAQRQMAQREAQFIQRYLPRLNEVRAAFELPPQNVATLGELVEAFIEPATKMIQPIAAPAK